MSLSSFSRGKMQVQGFKRRVGDRRRTGVVPETAEFDQGLSADRRAWFAARRRLDAEFGTADFFLLLDFGTLKDEYLKRLGLTDLKVSDAPA